jgi:dihydrofolate reductase
MGRKTFESLPKALPNRTNIVVSRNQNYAAPGIILCPSIEAALEYAKEDSQPFVIGGGQIYKQALAYAQTIELTRVHQSFEADTFFPKIDSSQWEEVHREAHPKTPEQPLAYTYITYKKIPF